MGFIIDSTDQYILNTDQILKVYCQEDFDGYGKTSRWILWAECPKGRFTLDTKDSYEEIRDSFWRYYESLTRNHEK